jgi:hypothetical protein
MGVTTRRTLTKATSPRGAAPPASRTVRRSFALPRHIVTEATAVAPAELQTNLNRLVTVALEEYTATRKQQAFEAAMAAMAADPAVTRVSSDLLAAFRTTEADGLPDD